MTRLVGPRVVLRPLEPADGDAWREVRWRNREWLEPWEPLPEPGSPDLMRDAAAFRARCASGARQRHLDTAHPLAIFLHDGTLAGEIRAVMEDGVLRVKPKTDEEKQQEAEAAAAAALIEAK